MHRRLALVLLAAGATALVAAAVIRLVTDDDRRDPTRASVAAEKNSPNDGPVRNPNAGTRASAAGADTGEGAGPGAPTSTAVPISSPTTRDEVEPMQVPAFDASIETVTAAQLHASWRPGCPVPVEDLRALDVSHWGLDGWVHTGRLIVHADQADRIVAVMRDLYAAHFPIARMVPVDEYGGDDQASMRANNTSGFNCRPVAGTTRWSEHAYGRAVDVNPLLNPYVRGGTVDPPEGAAYADRSRTDLGMIHPDDAAVLAFAAQGWSWGGDWTSGQDYQHFSSTGR